MYNQTNSNKNLRKFHSSPRYKSKNVNIVN